MLENLNRIKRIKINEREYLAWNIKFRFIEENKKFVFNEIKGIPRNRSVVMWKTF